MLPIAEVPSPCSGRRKDLELEPRYATEVLSLETSGIPRRTAVRRSSGRRRVLVGSGRVRSSGSPPELGVGEDELRSGMDNFSDGDLGLELEHSRWSPRSQQGPVAEFGGRLEGNEHRPSDDDRLVELGKARPGIRSAPNTSVSITIGPRDAWQSRLQGGEEGSAFIRQEISITISSCGAAAWHRQQLSTGSSRLPASDGCGRGFDISKKV